MSSVSNSSNNRVNRSDCDATIILQLFASAVVGAATFIIAHYIAGQQDGGLCMAYGMGTGFLTFAAFKLYEMIRNAKTASQKALDRSEEPSQTGTIN
jgi:hypothetical protein